MNVIEKQSATDHDQVQINDDQFANHGPRPPTLPGREFTEGDEQEEDVDGGREVRNYRGGGGGSGRVIGGTSPALTPRKSNLHAVSKQTQMETDGPPIKYLGGGHYKCPLGGDGSDIEPPLGYEPEGNATTSPPFTELGTPPYLKWAQSLRNLLDNRDGVELFKRYLQQERCEDSLDFWFACEGLKLQASDAPDRLHQLIKLIYRKYLRSHNAINISTSTRKTITDHLAAKEGPPDQRIFDVAQCEVEIAIKESTYPNFLKSDIYLQYVQVAQNGHGDLSPKCGGYGSTSASVSGCCSVPSSRSSSSGCRADVGGPLQTVMEDCELNIAGNGNAAAAATTLPLTSRHLIATQRFRAGYSDVRRPEAYAGIYLQQSPNSRAPNPYHALYASFIPGSAQDSELQSLSSDAHTDDTISLTDSSVDGMPIPNSRKYLRQQQRVMRQNANQNRDPFGQNTFIPRTQRLPTEKFPPNDPDKFAAILIQKLEAVMKVQESQEKVTESLRKLEYEESKNFACRQEDVCHGGTRPQQPLSSVILTAIRDGIINPDDNVQSILDEHVSRIWDDSSHQTPSNRSPPGRRSPPLPRPRSPDKKRTSVPAVVGNPYYNKSVYLNAYQHHRHRKDRDLVSTFSGDSGAVPDFAESEVPSSAGASGGGGGGAFPHKHAYHHAARTKMVGDIIDLPRAGLVEAYSVPQTDPRRSIQMEKRSSGKKFLDSSSSGVDSGVSLAYEPSSQISGMNSREKVMSWVLESKKYCGSHPDSEKDSSIRQKKSTYSSLSATSPVSNRQGRGKKQGGYNSSRSGSLERSGHMSWATNPQPNQPFMSDPSMPILPPPNTTTQLEEARRRLEDDTKAKLSKSKSGVLSKERSYHVDGIKSVRQPMLNKSLPCNIVPDCSDEGGGGGASNTKKSSKKLSVTNVLPPANNPPVVPTNTNVDFTAVVYQFFGEVVPYLSKLPGKNIVLKQFKTLITKKSNFRYFFKKASDEFDSGCVYEEITEDCELLPLFEGKIFARLEAID